MTETSTAVSLGSGAMFDNIAGRYDLLNRLISFGVDQRWRRRTVASLALGARARVLDLATGTADLAIRTAVTHPDSTVVGLDPSAGMLEVGRAKIAREKLDARVSLVVGDAEALPFEDASFDVATSVFGAMFAPDQEQTAAELLRVVKPGGRIGMANWTPDGGIAQLFAVIVRHTGGPPPGTLPPPLWGTEERLRELFGDGIAELRLERRGSRQAFRSADHYIEFFRTYFGPVKAAFDKVGPEGAEALSADLREFLEGANTGGDRALVIEPEYLQVIATRA